MTNYPLTPEQAALYGLARTTWRRRGNAKVRKLSFGEESITETILMDLAETFPGSLSIVPFSKPKEGKVGADWAWLFRDKGGTHNLPMLVQAKALDLSDFEYPEIKRHVGNMKTGRVKRPTRQIDLLIKTAQKLGWPAIYAFYNHLDDVSRIPDACSSLPASDAFGLIPDSWGVSIADAYMVRAALDDQTFDTHRSHSKPLHCLLCSGGRGVRPPSGSPALALNSLENLSHRRRSVSTEDRQFRGAPVPRLFAEPPELFQRALAITTELESSRRSEMVEELRRENPRLAGAVVLQDANTTQPER